LRPLGGWWSAAEELIVVDERAGLRRPVGLVTDRDLVVRVLTRGDCALAIDDVLGWMRAQIEAAPQLLEDPAAPPAHVR
jgi:hypothetical protein